MKNALERADNESMYSWVERIAPHLAGLPIHELRTALYDIVHESYVRGSRETLKSYKMGKR